MDDKKHKKANDLINSIRDASKRISAFDMIKGHTKSYPVSRVFVISGLGFKLDLTGKTLKIFQDKIDEILKNELSELEKQYKEL